MISVIRYSWRTAEQLEEIANSHPEYVWVDGKNMHTSEPFSGYLTDLEYGPLIIAQHGNERYGFSRRTNNTIQVWGQ